MPPDHCSTSAQSAADILLEVLNRRLSHGKCQDKRKYVAIVEDLLRAEVCFRCVLRIFRHMKWEDYCLDEPNWRDLLQCLQQATGQGQGTGKDTPRVQQDGSQNQMADSLKTSPSGSAGLELPATDAMHIDEAVAVTEGATDSMLPGQQQVENVSQEPLPVAGACDPPDQCGSSGAETHAAVVCTLCLGLLQRIQGTHQSPGQEPAGPLATGPFSTMALSSLSPGALCQALQRPQVEFNTFAIDVSLPLSIMLRDRILAEHMSAKYGWMGIFKHNSDQMISLKVVLRRVLGSMMLKQLGEDKKLLDGGTDLTLALTLDHPGARLELRPLIEGGNQMGNNMKSMMCRVGSKGAKMDKKKQVRSLPKPEQQMSNRQRKKLRKYGNTEPGVLPEAVAASQACNPVEEAAAPQEDQGTTLADDAVDDVAIATDALLADISVEKALAQVQSVPSHVFKRLFPWPLKSLGHPDPCTLNLRLTRASVFLAGRYLKLRRGMPQSRWFDPQTGQRIGCVSLAERIEEAVLPLYAADESKFVSGGREDADVRMLNEGRPFVLELINPQHVCPSTEDLAHVEQALSEATHGARAIQLTPCTKKAMDKIKEAEESKEKTYLAFCWAERPLAPDDVECLMGLKDLVILQDTPLRVLHRRAPKVRSKKVTVESVAVVPQKPCYFSITLRTQAGTYIKEFCHGDLGRTQPNLGSLLSCRTEILQLDVVAVHMPDWP